MMMMMMMMMMIGEFPAVTTLVYMAKHDKPMSRPVVLTIS